MAKKSFDEFLQEFDPALGIQPYQFEPQFSSSNEERSSGEESDMEEEGDLSRLANSIW